MGLTLSDAFLIHMHVWIWFRQFCFDEPTTTWAYLGLFALIAPYERAYPFSLFYSSLQALNLKNHDSSLLRKFQSFGIVLGMGALLIVVAHNKCGCAHTCFCSWIAHLYILCQTWKFLFLY